MKLHAPAGLSVMFVLAFGHASAFAQTAPEAPTAAAPKPTPTATPTTPSPAAPTPIPSDPTHGEAMRAYHDAMQKRRLAPTGPLRRAELGAKVAEAEAKIMAGRDAEAIAMLTEIVESADFPLVADSEEGRAAVYQLGASLTNAGVYASARAYLRRSVAAKDAFRDHGPYARRAVQKLAEIALVTRDYAAGLSDLESVPPDAPPEVRAEVSYVAGRAKEATGDVNGALASYAVVPQTSRFWSQATYLSGLIEVERGRMREGEDLFCKVADPKRQDKTTPVFADPRFFAVRDLARLALGRVAHEQYRFDDARYYYYLVPQDSDRLAEALYESATSRYEKKDYEGARELLRQLRTLDAHHRYEDEAQILDAYVDLALCHFPESDAKLRAFLSAYGPVRDAARRLAADPQGMKVVLEAARAGADAGGVDLAGARIAPEHLRTVAMLVRVDPNYGEIARKRAVLDRELGGLRTALGTIADMQRSLATTGGVRPALVEDESAEDKAARARQELRNLRALVAEVASAPPNGQTAERVATLRAEVSALEARLGPASAAASEREVVAAGDAHASDLPELFATDAAHGRALVTKLEQARQELEEAETLLARDALRRLDLRLSRLLRRARLGRIESVLGKKRALEVEVEALNAGFLPREALDALDAARYLRDNEEYWPFEGDDWPDEFVGSEGRK